MQDLGFLLPANINALSLSLAGGIASLLVFALKSLFTLVRKIAQKTPTTVDDALIDETEKALRDKSGEI